MEVVQTGGTPAPAAGGQGQGQTAPAAVQTNPQGAPAQAPAPQTVQPPAAPQQVTVPLDVVTSVRGELQQAKEQNRQLQARLQTIEMAQQFGGFQQNPVQQPIQQQPVQQAAPPQGAQTPDPFQGLEDDEIVNVKDLRKIVGSLVQRGAPDAGKELEPIKQTLAQVMVQLQDPNYEQTIRTYLPDMINGNPYITQMIMRSPNRIMAALAVAKMSPRYASERGQQGQHGQQPIVQQQPPDPLVTLQQIIENASRPGSPAQMGGGGAFSGNDRFRSMSDKDFDAEVARVMSGRR